MRYELFISSPGEMILGMGLIFGRSCEHPCYASIRKSSIHTQVLLLLTSARKPISLILFMERDTNVSTLYSLNFPKEY